MSNSNQQNSSSTAKRNSEQQRAAEALKTINQRKGNNKDQRSEYLSAIKALPAAILQNGLGQTLASYRAASTTGPTLIYKDMHNWLCGEHQLAQFAGQQDLLEALFSNDQNRYIAAQTETLAYARWLKKLAVALLQNDQQLDQQNPDNGDTAGDKR